MFTIDNSTFDADAIAELNDALETLMADVDENDDQSEQAYSDKLNNAWNEGMTAAELVAAVTK